MRKTKQTEEKTIEEEKNWQLSACVCHCAECYFPRLWPFRSIEVGNSQNLWGNWRTYEIQESSPFFHFRFFTVFLFQLNWFRMHSKLTKFHPFHHMGHRFEPNIVLNNLSNDKRRTERKKWFRLQMLSTSSENRFTSFASCTCDIVHISLSLFILIILTRFSSSSFSLLWHWYFYSNNNS